MKLKYIIAVLFLVASYLPVQGQSKSLEVKYTKNNDNSYDFTYSKNVPGSYTIVLEFTNLTNARYTGLAHVVKSSRGLLFKLTPIDDSKGISFSWKYKYVSGAVAKKIKDSFVYLLPFPNGSSVSARNMTFLKEEYFEGEKSDTWQSYSLAADSDSIMCIRKGVVVRVENDYDVSSDVVFTSNLNRVIVEHSDRSLAAYKGFDKGGIVVKPGDTVYPHSYLGSLSTGANSNDRELVLNVFYSTEINLDFKKKKATMQDKDSYTYVKPLFYTANKSVRLNEDDVFVVDSTKDIIEEEMSKREKKKYKAND